MQEPDDRASFGVLRGASEEEQDLMARLGQRSASCPPVDVLLVMGEDVLPVEVERAAARHVEMCALCSQLLTDWKAESEAGLLRATDGPRTLEDQRIRARIGVNGSARGGVFRLRAGVWATAAALLLGLGLTAWRWSHSTSGALSGSTAHLETPAPTPKTAAIAQEARLEIPFTPLAPPDGGSGLATRGGPQAEPSMEVLLPAFRAYNKGEYSSAAAGFARLDPEYPRSVLLPLYLGVSRLAAGEDAPATASLRRAIERSSANGSKQAALGDDARWYLAIAANRQQDAAESGRWLRALCASPTSVYSARSCQLLGTSAKR